MLPGLPGSPGDLAKNNIPDSRFPLADPKDSSMHPRLAVVASRTRLLVSFTDTATVAEANAAMAKAKVVIIGGLPRLGIVLVATQDTGDFVGIETAQSALRANPAVESAAMSFRRGPASRVEPAPGSKRPLRPQ